MPNELLSPFISASSGLIGVLLGAWITTLNQKRERRQHYIREQLDGFYAPMLALRTLVLAKGQTRMKITGAADTAWRSAVDRAYRVGIDAVERLDRERSPLFDRIIDHNNRQLAEEIIPAYQRMRSLCTEKMHLAERSTRQHFAALTEFVELWNRWLAHSIPPEVVKEFGHSEEELIPFYEDLSLNFERLQKELR